MTEEQERVNLTDGLACKGLKQLISCVVNKITRLELFTDLFVVTSGSFLNYYSQKVFKLMWSILHALLYLRFMYVQNGVKGDYKGLQKPYL